MIAQSWFGRGLVCQALGLVVLIGCGPRGELPTGPVSGKIMFRGKPVPTGTIMFVPEQGPPAVGQIMPDGTYVLGTYGTTDGAVLGRHKVSITALEDTSGLLPEQQTGTPASLLPAKYLSHDTSGLTEEVKSSDNEINFDLTE